MTRSALSSARLAPRCPDWLLSGPGHPLETSLNNFGSLRASQVMTRPVRVQLGISKPFWCCEDHLWSVRIWTCLFQRPILFCKYLSPLILHKNGSVFRIFIWISVIEETNGLEIRFLVPDILNKYKRSILFGTPCIFLETQCKISRNNLRLCCVKLNSDWVSCLTAYYT